MKKRFFFCIAAIILSFSLLMTGCGIEYTTQEATYVPEEDFQHQYVETSGAGMGSIVEAEDGYYFWISNYLFYADKQSLNAVPVCQKQSCLHADNVDPYTVANCGAFVKLYEGTAANNLFYYHGKLYYPEWKAGTKEVDLTEMNLTDGSRKQICHLDFFPSCMALHRGFFYFGKNVYSDSTTRKYSLQRVSITSGSKRIETIFEGEMQDGNIQYILPYQNRVYFCDIGKVDDTTVVKQMVYDCLSGEVSEFEDHFEQDGVSYSSDLVGLHKEKPLLLCQGEDGQRKYMRYDPETGERTELFSLPDVFVVNASTDGTYIYNFLVEPDQELFLWMYDESGKVIAKIPVENNGGYPKMLIVPGNDLLFVCSYYYSQILAYRKEDLIQGIVEPYTILNEDINHFSKTMITEE